MIILGIDPGYGRVGWGVISFENNKAEHIIDGCLETSSKEDFPKRLELIYNFLLQTIQTHKADCLVVEGLLFNTNQKTAIKVAQAKGVILLSGQKLGIPVYEYTPLQVKNALVGFGRASKNQVQIMLKHHLKVDNDFKQDDAADALAVALTHAYTNPKLQF
jgi:crossover junction endodeoxyribonuclease RuvC